MATANSKHNQNLKLILGAAQLSLEADNKFPVEAKEEFLLAKKYIAAYKNRKEAGAAAREEESQEAEEEDDDEPQDDFEGHQDEQYPPATGIACWHAPCPASGCIMQPSTSVGCIAEQVGEPWS